MNPAQVLDRLRRLKVSLSLNEDGGIHCSAPAGVISLELRDAIIANRTALIVHLRARVQSIADVEDLRIRVLALATEAGFPRLSLQPGETVQGGMVPWAKFISRAARGAASAPDKLIRAEMALQALCVRNTVASEAPTPPQTGRPVSEAIHEEGDTMNDETVFEDIIRRPSTPPSTRGHAQR